MDDLFTPISDDQTTIPENPLEALVGDDKKFKSVEDLARGKLEADQYIARLQREHAEMREQIGKSQTLEEIKTTILSTLKQEKPQEQPTPPAREPDDSKKINSDDLEGLVASLLEKKDAERRTKTNAEEVSQTLQEKFGNDAQMILNQKARELSVSLDYLKRIANESPKAFFKLIGLDGQATPATPTPAPRPSVSIPSQVPNSGVRDEAYYEKLKRTNPTEYFSPKVMHQMHKDLLKLRTGRG